MRTRALAPLAVRSLVDGTALAAPLFVLPPCVLGLRTAIGTASIALAPVVTALVHDGSVLVLLAVADPHVSVVLAPVGIVIDLGIACGLLTGLTSPGPLAVS